MKRENGYYWVKFQRNWIIAKWDKYYRNWSIMDNDTSFEDFEFDEIDEMQIRKL